VEMKNAAKGLSVAYLDQRDRLNMQDRVAAVAEKEGFETSTLSILEQDYTPVEESHLLNPIFEKWAKRNLTETADFAVPLPQTTRQRFVSTTLTSAIAGESARSKGPQYCRDVGAH